MKRYITPEHLFMAAASVLTVGLSTGKGLLSVCTVALAFAACWRWVVRGKPILRQRETLTMIWMTGLFVISLVSGLWTANSDRWLQDVYEKIPLLLIPPALYLMPALKRQEWIWIRLIFLATQSVVAIATLIRFAYTYEAQMQRVAENAFIDVIGSISHIYFGLLLGWSAILGIHLWMELRKTWKPIWHIPVLILTLINAAAIHVLVSRTGLIGFYGGLAVLGIVGLWQQKQRWLVIGLLAGLVLLPVLAYYTIPSFQTRVRVTIWDAEQYYYQPDLDLDLSDNSLSLRLLAWEASWGVISTSPWIGVGMEDVGEEMLHQYELRDLSGKGENLLTNPHNQYLKQWAGAGLIGLLLLVLALIQPLWEGRSRVSPLTASFVMMMALAMCFESLLERQIGMTMFAIFGMWLLNQQEMAEE